VIAERDESELGDRMKRTLIKAALSALAVVPALAAAADDKGWVYRGVMVWDHPDGRRMNATVADRRFRDDSLTIARNTADSRWYILFTYRRDVRFASRKPHFYIETQPPSVPRSGRQRIRLEGEPRVFQRNGERTKYIAAQLTAGDRGLMTRYTGHYVGASYSIEGQPAPSLYEFSGIGLGEAIAQVSRSDSPANGQAGRVPPRSQAKPAAPGPTSDEALLESRDKALMEKMSGFRMVAFPCTEPQLLRPITRKGYDALQGSLKSFAACTDRAVDLELGQLMDFARGQLGAKVERRPEDRAGGRSFIWTIHCGVRCRRAFRAFVDQHTDAIDGRLEKRRTAFQRGERYLAGLDRMLKVGGQ